MAKHILKGKCASTRVQRPRHEQATPRSGIALCDRCLSLPLSGRLSAAHNARMVKPQLATLPGPSDELALEVPKARQRTPRARQPAEQKKAEKLQKLQEAQQARNRAARTARTTIDERETGSTLSTKARARSMLEQFAASPKGSLTASSGGQIASKRSTPLSGTCKRALARTAPSVQKSTRVQSGVGLPPSAAVQYRIKKKPLLIIDPAVDGDSDAGDGDADSAPEHESTTPDDGARSTRRARDANAASERATVRTSMCERASEQASERAQTSER